MNCIVPVLVVIVSFLTVVIYCSTNFVSAIERNPTLWICGRPDSPYEASCGLTKDGKTTLYNCTYDKSTKKWNCVTEKAGSAVTNQMPGSKTLNKMTDSQIPLGLKSALDSAIKSQNGGLVIGQSNTTVTNSSEMRINGQSRTITNQSPSTLKGGTDIS